MSKLKNLLLDLDGEVYIEFKGILPAMKDTYNAYWERVKSDLIHMIGIEELSRAHEGYLNDKNSKN